MLTRALFIVGGGLAAIGAVILAATISWDIMMHYSSSWGYTLGSGLVIVGLLISRSQTVLKIVLHILAFGI